MHEHQIRPTVAQVDLAALRRNLGRLRTHVGPSRILAAVKGDAYGHGAQPAALALQEEGCDWFGVALVEEGVLLRQAGIHRPILLLSGTGPSAAPSAVRHDLTSVVYDLPAARALARLGRERGQAVPVHLKVDTGMGRLGVPLEAWGPFLDALTELDGLHVQGVLSHLADAESDPAYTEHQQERFTEAVRAAQRRGHRPEILHLANSAGLVSAPSTRMDLVRPGLLLYGAGPVPSMADELGLEPVMRVRTEVLYVKEVPAGQGLSYGLTWRASRPSRIATLPIGYADGYPRALSNRAEVLVRGYRAPVRGNVCMDLMLVDVTEVPEPVEVGDEVVLLGTQGDQLISAEELAGRAGTIPYEILCGFSERVPRLHGALP